MNMSIYCTVKSVSSLIQAEISQSKKPWNFTHLLLLAGSVSAFAWSDEVAEEKHTFYSL